MTRREAIAVVVTANKAAGVTEDMLRASLDALGALDDDAREIIDRVYGEAR